MSYLRSVYAIWARFYDSVEKKLFAFDRKKVIRELNLKRNNKVLEVGVGTGLNLPHYPANVSVTGIDFSPAMIKQARKKGTKAKLKVTDASRTGFAANSFDKALATYVLRVSPNPKAVLNEVARVTKKGARFVILDQFVVGFKSRVISTLFSPFTLVLGWGRNLDLNKLLRNTGWRVLRKKRFGRAKETLLVVLENNK